MKRLFYFLLLNVILFSAKAQDVTLFVRQKAPLQITTGSTVYNILLGNKLVLGSDLRVSGGTAPYQISWSGPGWVEDSIKNTITIKPTVYSIYTCRVIDANNCTQEQTIQVNVINPIQLQLIINQISCFGKNDGAIIMNVTGGAPPYTIAWADMSNSQFRIKLGPGNYSVRVTDAMGQQKDTSVILIESAQINTTLNKSICDGSSFFFNGKVLTETGTYSGTFHSESGCDSVVTLNLTVNPKYSKEIVAEICQGDTYLFAGVEFNRTGRYENKLHSVYGCDSTIFLNLKVNPVYNHTIEASICQGETYLFAGVELDQTGKYENKLQSKSGCDSIISLNLTVNPVYDQTNEVAICKGDSYLFAGVELTQSGRYTDSLKTISGCDSIIHVNLTVNPIFTQTFDTSICRGKTYLFGGNELAESGQYRDRLKTITGCDSIIILNLIVNPILTQTIDASICQGEIYLFGGVELAESGHYRDTVKTLEGCDMIMILNLIVNPIYTQTSEAAICQGETYIFAGRELKWTGEYENRLQSIQGCDSIFVLNLMVNPLPNEPGIVQKKNSLYSTSENGNQWFKDGLGISDGINQVLDIKESGDYVVIVTNNFGCSTQSDVYHAVYTSVPLIQTADLTCKIFPNPNNGLFSVEINSDKQETIFLKLFSVDGRTIAVKLIEDIIGKQSFQFGKENLLKGVYTLQIQYGAQILNRKLIVE